MSSRRGRSNFWRGHRQRGHNNSSRNSQCGPSSCSRTGQILPAQNGCISQVQHRRPRQVQTSLISCPFKKWSLYFPDCGDNSAHLMAVAPEMQNHSWSLTHVPVPPIVMMKGYNLSI
ncbi:hypothetical protein P5673_008208 [Acropora cervicornis]|uniref:Uncharacterized protein n=1 Tax=Acropora cervicornis TaxID=6130 RepID=A0AAD9QUM7_ACRCE|nr:hypothetical protein P5673_008208 [Acropora cervicornis]